MIQSGDETIYLVRLENGDAGVIDEDGNVLAVYQDPDVSRPQQVGGQAVAQTGSWVIGGDCLGKCRGHRRYLRHYGTQGLRALRALGNSTYVVVRGAATAATSVAGATVGIALIAIATPSNIFDGGAAIVYEGENHRFFRRPGDLYGSLQVQTAAGDWVIVPGRNNVSLEQLTDTELEQLQAPLTGRPSTPIAPDRHHRSKRPML